MISGLASLLGVGDFGLSVQDSISKLRKRSTDLLDNTALEGDLSCASEEGDFNDNYIEDNLSYTLPEEDLDEDYVNQDENNLGDDYAGLNNSAYCNINDQLQKNDQQ